MTLKKTYCCIILFSYWFIFSQDAKPDKYQDSLQNIIDHSKSIITKKEALYLLGEHLVQRNPTLAEQIAVDLKNNYVKANNESEIIRLKNILAASNRWQGNYKSALELYYEIYNYHKLKKDSLNLAKTSQFIGSLLMFMGRNVESQKYLLEASSLFDKVGTPNQKASILNSLAGFYLNLNQFDKGKASYLKALKQFEMINDSVGLSSANANLGFIYTELNDFKKAQFHLLASKKYLSIFPTKRELGFHHDFLGLLRQKEGKLNEALIEHEKALKIRENLSSTYNLCESKLNMGQVLIKLKRYNDAIKHLEDVFKFVEHDSYNQQVIAYELLSQAYEKLGDYQNSLNNYKLFKTINDSIYSKESLEIITEKESIYQMQKKDSEIQILNKEKEITQQKLKGTRHFNIFVLITLLIISIVFYALYKMYTKIKTKKTLLEKAIHDRNLLLHETHHRVKNNLQMISSLFNLQSKYVADKKAFEVLQNGRNRIESIALVHKNLYAEDNLTTVNLQHYFENLTDSIIKSYGISENEINVIIYAKNINLDLDIVMSIGLIINELVTNAIKHAWPKKNLTPKTIEIHLKEESSTFLLLVKDNGIGIQLPKNNEIEQETFGKRLIRSFVQKLKATIEQKVDNGTTVMIQIPKTNA